MTDLWEKVRIYKTKFLIPDVWESLQLPDPPARCGITVRSPFRHDGARGSFQILKSGTGYVDHGGSAGEGVLKKGDQVGFIMAALGCDKTTAAKHFVIMAGGTVEGGVDPDEKRRIRRQPRRVEIRPGQLQLPEKLLEGSGSWHGALADLRGLSVDGVRAAVDAGVLRFVGGYVVPLKKGKTYKCASPCWIVLDPDTRCNAQIRRLDGSDWFAGSKWATKALTLTGSWGGWPIGLSNLGAGDDVLLCEGGPDLLAGYEMRARGMIEAVPVGMLGAGQDIPGGALAMFFRRRVLVAAHQDKGGLAALRKWVVQLKHTALSTHRMLGFDDGQDLNDWLRAGGSEVRTAPARAGQ